MVTSELVQQLSSAADDATRQLPEAHWLTRWYRESRFRAALERFVGLLYRIDVAALTDAQLAETERLTHVAKNLVEVHMLLRYTQHDVAECGYCTDVIARLRAALDALDSGLPMNPADRPSEEQLLAELALDLDRAGVR